ncbi:hypothetical protein FBALC1_01972 [Flavobacteriales bacterium ALC-1]|nr:hypothetical protein FBALC1_01972 [Flavobacteriales bacterium ALC-1]
MIDEIDIANKTFTGTYRFLAFDVSGLNSVGLQMVYFIKFR